MIKFERILSEKVRERYTLDSPSKTKLYSIVREGEDIIAEPVFLSDEERNEIFGVDAKEILFDGKKITTIYYFCPGVGSVGNYDSLAGPRLYLSKDYSKVYLELANYEALDSPTPSNRFIWEGDYPVKEESELHKIILVQPT